MDDVKAITFAAFRGFIDSFKGILIALYIDKEINEKRLVRLSPANSPVRRNQNARESTPIRIPEKHERSKIRKRIIQCAFLNGGIFFASIILFDYGLLPMINFILGLIFDTNSMGNVWWIHTLLSYLFQTAWVVPLFLISRLVNVFWFQDIANSAYRHNRGRPVWTMSLSKVIADLVFGVVIQTLFLFQAVLVNYIPFGPLGTFCASIHMCLLYSLYSFDYKWSNMGWELHKRLAFIELNWPYFVGFGLPLTFFTQAVESCSISGCIFAILFPFFIISGNEVSPVIGVCKYPIRIFSPVVMISNVLFNWTFRWIKVPQKA